MPQHDHVINNDTGANVRSDINGSIAALVTQNEGSSPPSTTYKYMPWPDTSNNLFKRRNAANSAWVTVGSLDEVFAVARSSNTILGVADRGKIFIATSTFTQTLTAAATLGDGWACDYRNNGSGTITIDPNSSETIDGLTTISLAPGEGCRIHCDSTNFVTTGRAGATFASNAQMEAATSLIVAASPGTMKYAPSVAKAWGLFDGTAGTPSLLASHNSTGITDNGTGSWTITVGDDFSTAHYAGFVTAGSATDATNIQPGAVVDKAVGSFRIDVENTAGANVDMENVQYVCFGDL